MRCSTHYTAEIPRSAGSTDTGGTAVASPPPRARPSGPMALPGIAGSRSSAPFTIGRLRPSAAERPAPPARGLDLDETAGSGLLLAVQRHERDIQVMRRGDVRGVGAAEPDLGG